MFHFKGKVSRIGTSYAIIIPKPIIDFFKLTKGSELILTADDNRIQITPFTSNEQTNPPYTISRKLIESLITKPHTPQELALELRKTKTDDVATMIANLRERLINIEQVVTEEGNKITKIRKLP